jgi:uncharacterized repeat protein (TIGR03833 family)
VTNYNQVPKRNEVKIGSKVKIAQKIHYESGEMTVGIVKEILTSRPDHPRGIKVRLTNGIIGRVQALGDQPVVPLNQETVAPNETEKIDYTPEEDELL